MPKRILPEPRSWLSDGTDPSDFGRRTVEWKQGTTRTERALIAAARQQHDSALTARTRLRDQGHPAEALAADLGITVDQLRRLLRGEAHLNLADAYLLREHLRPPTTPPPRQDAP